MNRNVLIIINIMTLFMPSSIYAEIISIDWKDTSDNLITLDTYNNLEWLDLTVTANISTNQVDSKLSAGGELNGWRYATREEVTGFFNAFGGVEPYDGWSKVNNGLFDIIAPYWGDLHCNIPQNHCSPGEGITSFYIAEISGDQHHTGKLDDNARFTWSQTHDWVDLDSSWFHPDYVHYTLGSALVRSAVPIPGAIWLFVTGILGLTVFLKRR